MIRGLTRRCAPPWLRACPVLGLLLLPAVPTTRPPDPPGPPLVLVHATILTMTDAGRLRDQTILVRDGRIAALGPGSEVPVPAGAMVVDLAGRHVMPGLADMHVHNVPRDRLLFVGSGITAIRGMWGAPGYQELQDSVRRGLVPGPWMYFASPGIDAHPPSWPLTQFVDSLPQVGPAVERLARQSWRWLKIYNRLSRAVYDSIAATARARGIGLVGHVPWAVPLEDALSQGQLSIEHLSGYDVALGGRRVYSGWADIDTARIPRLVGLTVAAGTWNCPTMAIAHTLAARNRPGEVDRADANRGRLLLALYRAGAHLLIGTDSGIDIVPAGTALADEMARFVAAGIPAEAVLRIATRDAAAFIGPDADWGQIRPGFRADLLVLDRDPQADIGAVREPAGLVLHGTWLSRETLKHYRRGGR